MEMLDVETARIVQIERQGGSVFISGPRGFCIELDFTELMTVLSFELSPEVMTA
jgi:hypothetical protein